MHRSTISPYIYHYHIITSLDSIK